MTGLESAVDAISIIGYHYWLIRLYVCQLVPNQTKSMSIRICTAAETKQSIYIHYKQCQTIRFLKYSKKCWEVQKKNMLPIRIVQIWTTLIHITRTYIIVSKNTMIIVTRYT